MKFKVFLFKAAQKSLDRLDHKTFEKIQDKIEQLSLDPLSPRLSKPLKMAKDRRSARVGDWRIIFRIDEAKKEISITEIEHRSKVYGGL